MTMVEGRASATQLSPCREPRQSLSPSVSQSLSSSVPQRGTCKVGARHALRYTCAQQTRERTCHCRRPYVLDKRTSRDTERAGLSHIKLSQGAFRGNPPVSLVPLISLLVGFPECNVFRPSCALLPLAPADRRHLYPHHEK